MSEVTDTFYAPCLDCGTTVHTVGGKQQPHACVARPWSEALVHAYWQGHKAGRTAR